MIIGVLFWFLAGTGQAQGTVISGVKVSSVLRATSSKNQTKSQLRGSS